MTNFYDDEEFILEGDSSVEVRNIYNIFVTQHKDKRVFHT